MEPYNTKVETLLTAYRTGTAEAMERHWSHTWHRRSWDAMRRYVLADLGKPPVQGDIYPDITTDDARALIAREFGFENWSALVESVGVSPLGAVVAARPVHIRRPSIRDENVLTSRDWDAIIDELGRHGDIELHAEGAVSDAIAERLSRVEGLTSIRVNGSKALTDAGVRALARLPGLRALDISGTSVGDEGLRALGEVRTLEEVSMVMTDVTDAGVAHLARCDRLNRVNMLWTRTGDGALRALANKENLSRLSTGNAVTDNGLSLLHQYPVFSQWRGAHTSFDLFSPDDGANHLSLRGSFTDEGMKQLRGLNGLAGLDIAEVALSITPHSLSSLVELPHLARLSCEATNESMRYIAQMPALRFLSCQDTEADDEGFAVLSRSKTLEYIWGRRCHNLRHDGFIALSKMPALRGLSVSCRNVDDAALAELPSFPALRELMPMDVPDEGYRHIGKCERLQALLLMYCRDTTDAATEHIMSLRRLTKYFASYTQITDRTPQLLATIESLESITFDSCAGVTDAGVAALSALPRLRELRISGQNITSDVVRRFGPQVRVRFTV